MKLKRVLKKLALWTVSVAALTALGAAIYFGIIDVRDVKTKAKYAVENARARAVGAATSTPGISGGARASAQVCRQNLKRLESAKRALHSQGMFATGTVSWSAIEKELRGRPTCPGGGQYSLGTVEQMCTCSVGAAGTPDSSDDHIIAKY